MKFFQLLLGEDKIVMAFLKNDPNGKFNIVISLCAIMLVTANFNINKTPAFQGNMR